MNSIRKYVRFYENKPEDMKIYHELCKYESYGFRSENQMILEALHRYLFDRITNLSPEEFADLIVDRLSGKFELTSDRSPASSVESKTDDSDIYDAALNFLDTL